MFVAASIVMTFLVTTKLVYLLTNPKKVNVDFKFVASLPFPAVTICNENPYRYHCNRYMYSLILSKMSFQWRIQHCAKGDGEFVLGKDWDVGMWRPLLSARVWEGAVPSPSKLFNFSLEM